MHTKAFCTAVVDKLDEDTGNSFGVLKGLCNVTCTHETLIVVVVLLSLISRHLPCIAQALGLKPNKKNVTPEACTKQYEKFMAKYDAILNGNKNSPCVTFQARIALQEWNHSHAIEAYPVSVHFGSSLNI